MTEQLFARLRGAASCAPDPIASDDAVFDEDLQLALYACFELHYRGFEGVRPDMEWAPDVIALRGELGEAFLADLESRMHDRPSIEPGQVGATLFEIAKADEAPSTSRYLGASGSVEELREFAIHRSAYQLKEADPHSWAIPRLSGPPKTALLEVQYDEYGSGDAERAHSLLFAKSMDALGLDSTYGHYLDRIPAITLATVNLMSQLGLHRARRGALVGHLAMFEITSAEPNRRLANGVRRLGFPEAAGFFDEHVEADSVHENVAAYDLAQGLAVQQHDLVDEILFGAAALIEVEGLWSRALLDAWKAGESSLRGEGDGYASSSSAEANRVST